MSSARNCLILPAVCLLAIALFAWAADPVPTSDKPPAEVKLQAVKYPELSKAVRELRGKIVVVDLWATWCPPCKAGFAHFVELQRRYGDQGVVCVSVALDEAKDHKEAFEFLQQKKAAFANYRLDEEAQLWQERFDINGPPAVFVFNRENRRAGKFDYSDPNKQFTHKDVEKLVQELLQPTP